MGNMHSYPHHIGDFAKATRGLTLTERGAYRELLDQYYAHEAPLPLDKRERYRLAGAVTLAERVAVDYVVAKFFEQEDDGHHQKRADAELAKYHIRHSKALAASVTRWAGDAKTRPKHAPSNARSMLDEAPSNARADAQTAGEQCLDDARPMLTKTVISNNGAVTSNEAARADWMRSPQGIVDKGKSVGIEARPGEALPQLRMRVLRAIAEHKHHNSGE
jgi:uncharacterized protein YdaU (DUF1376 family)